VVKNEKRQRYDNQPYGDWDERIQAMVFPSDHPYHHTVIGSMADLDAASLEDVENFFRTYYAPNNAVLTLCGDFDPAHARGQVERYFGEIPPGPPVPTIPGRTQLPERLGEERRLVVAQEITLPRVYVAYRIPAFGEPDFYAALVASAVLATGKASLLYRTLLREQGIAQDVVAYAFPIVVGASMLVLWATARPQRSLDQLEAALHQQVESLCDVSDADVERAIRMLEARQLMDLQTVDERADQLSMYTTLFDDPGRVNTELERVRAVTPAAVRAFARDRLRADNRAVLRYVPRGGAV
jgi:predicted Zn-dependent peptidase